MRGLVLSLSLFFFAASTMAGDNQRGIGNAPCAFLDSKPTAETMRALDFGNLCRYEKDNSGVKRPTKIVFMGDSITQFWGADKDLFSAERGFINRGISGQTTMQMVLRFRADVIALKPEVVHILAGTNDIAGNTGPTTLTRIQNNIQTMVEIARANGIRVVLGSILPTRGYDWAPEVKPVGPIAAMNQWLKKYAQENEMTFIDYYSRLDDGNHGLPKALSEDGVHVNAGGYTIMKQILLESLDF